MGAGGTRGATNKYSALSSCSSDSSSDSDGSDDSVKEIKSPEVKDNAKLVRKRAASAAAASGSDSESDSAGGAAEKFSPHSKRAKGDGKSKLVRKRAPAAANGKRKAVEFSSDSDSEEGVNKGNAINRIMQAAEVLPRLQEDFGKKFRRHPSLYTAIAAMLDLDRSTGAKLKRRKPSTSPAKTERRKLEAMAVNAIEVYRVEASSGSASRAAFGRNLIEIARKYEVLL